MKLELHKPDPTIAVNRTPLLFIHGAWHGAWCWHEYFVPYFTAAGFAVYTVSVRGHGESEGRNHLRWMRIRDYVNDIEDTIVQELPTHPILIGHSMGGLIVQKYLERHTVPGAVLLASVPPAGVLATTLRIARRHPKAFVQANLTLSLKPLIGTVPLAHEAFFSEDMPHERVVHFFQHLQDESYCAFLDMLLLNRPRPKRITTPIFVLGAANDTIFHPSEVHATAQAYQTNAKIFPQMAHDMMLEERWQDVADTIIAWLDAQKL